MNNKKKKKKAGLLPLISNLTHLRNHSIFNKSQEQIHFPTILGGPTVGFATAALLTSSIIFIEKDLPYFFFFLSFVWSFNCLLLRLNYGEIFGWLKKQTQLRLRLRLMLMVG